jgi:hypothetical protein
MTAQPFTRAIDMLRCISPALHPADCAILLQGAVTEMTEVLSAAINSKATRHITLDADDIMPCFGVLMVRACPHLPLLVSTLLGALCDNTALPGRAPLQEAVDAQLGEHSLTPVLDTNQVEYSANMLSSFGSFVASMGSGLLASGEYAALVAPTAAVHTQQDKSEGGAAALAVDIVF